MLKTCGRFELDSSDSIQSDWAILRLNYNAVTQDQLTGLRLDDLRDLQYLVGRAIEERERIERA